MNFPGLQMLTLGKSRCLITDLREHLKEIVKKKKKKDMLQTYPLFNPSGILSQE